MKRLIYALILVVFLLVPSGAGAQVQFDMMIGGGLNKCMESGDADCDDIEASGALFFAPGLKFNNYLGLYLDMSYGWLSPSGEGSDDVTINTLYVMPTLRGIYNFEIGEVFGGLGWGYSRANISADSDDGDIEFTWSGWMNMKLTAGVVFKIAGPFSLGMNLDYIFNGDESGETCLKVPGYPEECQDEDQGDVADLFQASVIAKFTF